MKDKTSKQLEWINVDKRIDGSHVVLETVDKSYRITTNVEGSILHLEKRFYYDVPPKCQYPFYHKEIISAPEENIMILVLVASLDNEQLIPSKL